MRVALDTAALRYSEAMLLLLFACAADVSQTPACVSFVACSAARDVQLGLETDVARFGASGDCWGSPAGQQLCDEACDNGLTFLRDRYADLPTECAP